MNDNTNLKLWIWLSSKDSLNCVKKYKLYKEFKDITKIYGLGYDDYKKCGFLSDEDIDELMDKNADFDKLIDLYTNNFVKLVSIDMPEYPNLLKEITNPPILLYMRGNFIDLNNNLCIAMVGTRNATNYGASVAYNLSKELAHQGAIIVSGMALGIDTKCHEGALDANMPTVAVIGCGVNMVYPKSNNDLMKRIMETGMVISEYPLNSPPDKFHFPERNRIISGLSQGCVVVEADIKSGSLITAKYAYEQNRDVFAVPGNINSTYSKGTNYLIKDGAYCITCAEDVLYSYKNDYAHLLLNNNFNINTKKKEKTNTDKKIKQNISDIKENSDSIEHTILNNLTLEPIHIDKLCEKCSISVKDANSTLLYLELKRKILSHPGNYYSLKNETNQEE